MLVRPVRPARRIRTGRRRPRGTLDRRPQLRSRRRALRSRPLEPARALFPARPRRRWSAWLDRWGGILPLLVAEFVVWLGFGGLLPVLPLYFIEQGIDLATLGMVIAAWPRRALSASRSSATWRTGPRGSRDGHRTGCDWRLRGAAARPDRAGGVPAAARGRGLGAAIYDPAARGFLTDATPPDRRGEAFGLYGAAQMGGLLLGPSIGAFGAAQFGGIGFVFVSSAIAARRRGGRYRAAGARGGAGGGSRT